MDQVVTYKVNPERAQEAYLLMIDVLEREKFNRAEVVTALVVMLGTQYNGAVLGSEQTRQFAKDVTDWLAAYFAGGEKH